MLLKPKNKQIMKLSVLIKSLFCVHNFQKESSSTLNIVNGKGVVVGTVCLSIYKCLSCEKLLPIIHNKQMKGEAKIVDFNNYNNDQGN